MEIVESVVDCFDPVIAQLASRLFVMCRGGEALSQIQVYTDTFTRMGDIAINEAHAAQVWLNAAASSTGPTGNHLFIGDSRNDCI